MATLNTKDKTNKKVKKLGYAKVPGSRIRSSDVDAIGAELDALAVNGKSVDPDEVLKAAKIKTSAMHSYFTWNDEAAAYKQRVNEAKYLIRSMQYEISYVKVYHDGTEEKEETVQTNVRMFHSVRSEDEGVPIQVYKTVAEVMQNASDSESVYLDMYRYLLGAFHRFNAFSELAGDLGKIEGILLGMADKVGLTEKKIKQQISKIKKGV